MSVTSAMFSGVSGLLAQAEGINVIGNNLANVNTVGFKDGRTLFSDLLYTNIGNNSQLGSGTQVQKVSNLFTQSTFQTTANVTDLAIQGNSFFAVKDPNLTAPVNQNIALLTRAGTFSLDSNLNLVNPDGYQVLDTQGNPIKFNDNAAAITAANTAITTALTTAATGINTQAAAQNAAAGLATNPVINAAAAAYGAQVPAVGAPGNAADAFVTTVNTAAQGVYTAQTASMVTDAGNFVAAVAAAAAPVATVGETAAAAAIQTAALAAQTAAGVGTTSANLADTQAAIQALNTLVTANSNAFTTGSVIQAFNTYKNLLATENATIAATAPPAEIARAAAIQTAAALANTTSATAAAAPSPASVTAAKNALDALTTLTNNSTFTAANNTAAFLTFQGILATANSTITGVARPDEITAAIAIQNAAAAAQTAAQTAAATPSTTNNANAQTAFNALTALTNNSLFTTAAFTGQYSQFKTNLNVANTQVNDVMSTAAANVATGQTQLAAAKGLAFGKIASIDTSGLITYLGQDGATTNYYNVSGQVGLAATAANASAVQRLAVVKVANPNGLDNAGGSLFRSTVASGITSAAFSLATNSADGSAEVIKSDSLEQSNVDMASEFVNMMLTQRAYSANSKTITTADQMTQEVIGLIR